jgi:signal transduction histidine kinase
MSIRVKLILTYTILVLISAGILILSSFAIVAGFFSQATNAVLEDTDIGNAMYEVVDILAELKQAEDYSPEKLSDEYFIKQLNNSIDFLNGGIVVFSDGKYLNYSDLPDESWFYDDLKKNDPSREDGRRHEIAKADDNYVYFDYTFMFEDEEIVYFFVAEVSEFEMAGDQVGRKFSILILVILFIIVTPLLFILSKDIIKPLKTLENGANNIKEGNLDFKLKTRKKNEIGRVITSFERMRIELKKSIDSQVAYEENRKELISSISHDLKTPMTSIKGYVEGIMDGVANTPEKMDKYLSVIYQKSEDMDRLIDDLFLFSKLGINRLPFEMKKIKVVPFITQIVEEVKLEWDSDSLHITPHLNELEDESMVLMDEQKMKRVFFNIIQNSVKYMDKEHKKIDIYVNNNGDYIQFVISDNGRGIEEEHLALIFEKFYREDESRNTKAGGTGLGLAIAKQIVELHDGSITATSEVALGTKVIINLKKLG